MNNDQQDHTHRFAEAVSFSLKIAVGAGALVVAAFALATALAWVFPAAFGQLPRFVVNIGPFIFVALIFGSMAHMMNPEVNGSAD